jgi:hypothetical protein
MSYCRAGACLSRPTSEEYRYCVKHQMLIDSYLEERRCKWFNRILRFFRPLPVTPEVSAYAFTCGACGIKTAQVSKPETVCLMDKGDLSPICSPCLNLLNVPLSNGLQ